MKRHAPLVASDHKYCFRCATPKPVSEFYAAPSRPDGRDSRCKVCAREAARESRETRKRLNDLCRFFENRKGNAPLDLSALELDL